MQICRRWKRWRSISSEHRLQRDKGWKKTFVDRNEFGFFECRWLSMTFRFSPRDLRLFLSFLVWRSGKALEDVHRHILQSFIKRLCYEHTCRTTHMWSFKQRCPHRYELIDFPCSFRSLVLKLIFFPHSLCLAFLWTTRRDLHENFLVFIKPKMKKNVRKVIRLTTLSTNNSELTKIYFLPFVKQSRERTKTISLSLSGNKSSANFCSLFDVSWNDWGELGEKCVHSPVDPSRNFQTKTVNQSLSPSIKRRNAIKGRKAKSSK